MRKPEARRFCTSVHPMADAGVCTPTTASESLRVCTEVEGKCEMREREREGERDRKRERERECLANTLSHGFLSVD